MPQEEKIRTQSGFDLLVKRRTDGSGGFVISFGDTRKCLLHWGVKQDPRAVWQVPYEEAWPRGSRAYDHGAVQTSFEKSGGRARVEITLAGL